MNIEDYALIGFMAFAVFLAIRHVWYHGHEPTRSATSTLTDSAAAYQRYRDTERTVMAILTPALLAFQEQMFRRYGVTPDDVNWSIDRHRGVVTMEAVHSEPSMLFDIPTTLDVPFDMLEPEFDIAFWIEEEVWKDLPDKLLS